MHRKNQRNSFGNFSQRPDDFIELLAIIDIRWAMQCHQPERSTLEGQAAQGIRSPRCGQALPQGINHQIAYSMNAVFWNSLIEEIPPAAFFGHQQDVGNRIRNQPVDLLRHAPVAAA